MINIDDCKSLNDIVRKLYNKVNYTNREKVKKYLYENGIEWNEWLKNKKEESQLFCLNCGKPLKKGQYKFCSCKCAAIYNNHLRPHNPEEKNGKDTNKEENFCIVCGKLLKYHQSKFCSYDCQHSWDFNEYIKKWKLGEENGLRGEYGISNFIKRYLMEKNNCKCELCGWGEENKYTKKIPLEIHHKDGNYLNNNEENLQLLCPNCHSLTETFKSHNKNGRKGRKQ